MKKLVLFSLFLAAVVIVLGAYTRLTDAGLGCPDWPGCYGHLTVPTSEAKIDAANQAFPHRPVETHKAWVEMIHRYFAGALGLCILAIATLAVIKRKEGTPVKLPLLLLALVTFQAVLGMWTVTLNLLPVVVMGHLLGGFSVIACLYLLYLRLPTSGEHRRVTQPKGLRQLGFASALAVMILVAQIALGGWTSANYAALACTDMPICEDGWQQRLDFSGAYTIPEADNYEYGAHDYGQRMTMHIVHRAGALITSAYLLFFAILCLRHSASGQLKKGVGVMLTALCAQVALGVSNVVLSLPLFVAVAHNAVAAILLLCLVGLTWKVHTLQASHRLFSSRPSSSYSLNAGRLRGHYG